MTLVASCKLTESQRKPADRQPRHRASPSRYCSCESLQLRTRVPSSALPPPSILVLYSSRRYHRLRCTSYHRRLPEPPDAFSSSFRSSLLLIRGSPNTFPPPTHSSPTRHVSVIFYTPAIPDCTTILPPTWANIPSRGKYSPACLLPT